MGIIFSLILANSSVSIYIYCWFCFIFHRLFALCLNTKHLIRVLLKKTYILFQNAYNAFHQDVALIAQLDRALGYELRGREFESL